MEEEKGHFSDEYFLPVKIPVIKQLTAMMEPLRTMLADLISTTASMIGKDQPSLEDLLHIGSTVQGLSTGQQTLQVLSHLTDLSDSMAAIIKATQVTQAELLGCTVTKKDFKEVHSMMVTNTDLQLQLAKANAQNCAVWAEDIVMECMASTESEHD